MKTIICILFISLVSFDIQAQAQDNISEYQNVFAPSGIRLRATPSVNGQAISTLSFGQRVNVIEHTGKKGTYEWFTGEWVKVSLGHQEGFVFDAFLSSLPVPYQDFEITQDDLDLSYPLLAWAEYHFDRVSPSDTILSDHLYTEMHFLEKNIRLQREESAYHFKVTVRLPDTSISEAYNLLRAMLLTPEELESFNTASVFIAGDQPDIDHIKIQLDHPVDIRAHRDGSVDISVVTFHEACSL